MSTLRGFVIAASVTGVAAIGFLTVMSIRDPISDSVKTNKPDSLVREQIVRSAPRFDVVQLDQTGTANITGYAEAGGHVSLMIDDQEIAIAHAGGDGGWAMALSNPLPTGESALYLVAKTLEGQRIRSKNLVILSVPESRDQVPLAVLAAPGSASRVLQNPNQTPLSGDLALQSIDYDREGGVIFSGVGKPGLLVRVLLDAQILGEIPADATGRWSFSSDLPLSAGWHQLQIDQIETDKQVVSVLRIPFEPVAPTGVLDKNSPPVIVQSDASTWRIARRLYGQGWQYTLIYSSNQDQIRDPNVIYPKQVGAIVQKK